MIVRKWHLVCTSWIPLCEVMFGSRVYIKILALNISLSNFTFAALQIMNISFLELHTLSVELFIFLTYCLMTACSVWNSKKCLLLSTISTVLRWVFNFARTIYSFVKLVCKLGFVFKWWEVSPSTQGDVNAVVTEVYLC